jgi:diguanylate cyclase (GGDEF)-like protein/PAS domain S-box-containing protein
MRSPSSLLPVIAGFGVMLLLLLAVTAIGVTRIGHLSEQLTAIVSERNQKAEYAATMLGLHESRFQTLMLAASHDDPFLRDEEMMNFARKAADFIQVRDRFLAMPLDAEEFGLWNDIRGEIRHAQEQADLIFDLLRGDQLDKAREQIRRGIVGHHQRAMRGWGKLLDMQRTKNRIALDEALAARDGARRIALTLSGAAILVGAAIAVFVVRLSRRLEKDLFQEKERAQVTLQAIGDGVIRFDRDLRAGYLNPAAENMLGMTTRDAMDRPIREILRLFEQPSRQDLTAALTDDILKGVHHVLPATAILASAQGMEYQVEGTCSPIHTPDGEIVGGVLVIRDVTEARELNRRLIWEAEHDGLTGLLNRRAFNGRVERTLNSRRGGEFPMSLLFIDLDRFKEVNDSGGHAAGDELLIRIGELMQSRIRENDVLARLGGDEFGILLMSCPHDVAERIASQVRDSVANLRFVREDREYRVGACVGVVHVPPHWASLDECLAAADAACYKAKRNGRNTIEVHQQ